MRRRSSCVPWDATSHPPVARLHDQTSGRGRLRGCDGDTAAPCPHVATRASSRGRREGTRVGGGGRQAPNGQRGGSSHGARRRQPAVPSAACQRRGQDRQGGGAPETVEALVATRIDQLGPGDRALLRWASVLGVSFSGSLIADVLEDDAEVGAASEAWERLGQYVERDPHVPGAFRFRHALIRDAAYEGLSYKRRRELPPRRRGHRANAGRTS